MNAGSMRQFLRYAAVGAAATGVHYLVLVVCVEAAHWRAWLAAGYGAAIGAQVAYLGNRWFTFNRRAATGASWLRFQLMALGGALSGMAIVAVGTAVGLHYVLAQIVATGLIMCVTFVGNRHWTFR